MLATVDPPRPRPIPLDLYKRADECAYGAMVFALVFFGFALLFTFFLCFDNYCFAYHTVNGTYSRCRLHLFDSILERPAPEGCVGDENSEYLLEASVQYASPDTGHAKHCHVWFGPFVYLSTLDNMDIMPISLAGFQNPLRWIRICCLCFFLRHVVNLCWNWEQPRWPGVDLKIILICVSTCTESDQTSTHSLTDDVRREYGMV